MCLKGDTRDSISDIYEKALFNDDYYDDVTYYNEDVDHTCYNRYGE
jgi:hypothetical protein